MHGRAHHDRRKGKRDARIDARQQHGLSSATTGSGDGHALRIHLRQLQQEVERPHRVPGLETHDALEMRLGLRTIKPPVLGGVHLGPLFSEAVDQLTGKLLGIGVAQHVPLPYHTAHASQLDTHGLKAALASLKKALLTRGDFIAQFRVGGLGESRISPVAMRKQHGGSLAPLNLLRPVQVAGHEKPRRALELHLLHGVITAIDSPIDLSLEVGLGRHGPQSLRHQNPLAHLSCATFPSLRTRGGLKGKISVQILGCLESLVLRALPDGQRTGSVGGHAEVPGPGNGNKGENAQRGHEPEANGPPARDNPQNQGNYR